MDLKDSVDPKQLDTLIKDCRTTRDSLREYVSIQFDMVLEHGFNGKREEYLRFCVTNKKQIQEEKDNIYYNYVEVLNKRIYLLEDLKRRMK
jgi:hypothetical protein